MNFYELLKKHNVVIPVIQRDYAQGRVSEKTLKEMQREEKNKEQKVSSLEEDIGSKLLEDMKFALESGKQINLNFIYGKEINKGNDKVFYPVDGQQRLTTLFLLHLFAFYDSEEETKILERFSYQSRDTSKRFFSELIKYRHAIFSRCENNNVYPSFAIKDSSWFMDIYLFDPTIKSALNMLDKIYNCFKRVSNIAERLKSDDCPIIFNFLDAQNLGDIDNLYIKLNARGRALTSFEVFKADMLDYLEKEANGENRRIDREELKNISEDLDGSWMDIFWRWRKKYSDVENTDIYFLNFFGHIFKGYRLIINIYEKKWVNIINFKDNSDKKNGYYEYLSAAFETLKYMAENKNSKVEEILLSNINIKLDSNNDAEIDTTYENIQYFYAIVRYINKYKDNLEYLQDWLRVMHNLIENNYKARRVDNLKKLGNTIEDINNLMKTPDIIKFLQSQKIEVNGFDEEQFKEEVLKAQIIYSEKDSQLKSKKDAILWAEDNKYFNGKIGIGLIELLKEDTNEFIRNWEIITRFFDDQKGHSKFSEHNLLRRALLCIGDYPSQKTISNEYRTLCVDEANEGKKTPSLKTLFTDYSEKTEVGKIVKTFLEEVKKYWNKDDDKSDEEISKILNNIIKQNKSSIELNDYRYCFINFPRLFGEMSQSCLRIREIKLDDDGDKKEWCMIPQVVTSGINRNLYLYTLMLKLGIEKPDEYYNSKKGERADRYVEIGKNMKIGSHIKIHFYNDEYIVSKVNGEIQKFSIKKFNLNKIANEIKSLVEN